MVVIDSGFLIFLENPDHELVHPTTGLPVEHLRERIESLIDELQGSGEQIILPAPVLAEFMVKGGSEAYDLISELTKTTTFIVQPFDGLAAVEHAQLHREAVAKYGDKKGPLDGSWAQVKFDRQIVAIAKVAGATRIYTADDDVSKAAADAGIEVVHLADLQLSPERAQHLLSLETPDKQTEG